MTNVSAGSYKAFGDVPLAIITPMLTGYISPMAATAQQTTAAASPHSALFWAQAYLENLWETTGHIIHADNHNPVSLRPWNEDPRGMPKGATGVITASDGGQFLKFATDADCAREWKRRLFDDPNYKGGVYRNAVTLDQMLNAYAPPGDVHPVTGVDNADIGYADTVRTMLAKFAALEAQGDTTVSTQLVFGKVPFPGYLDHQAATANKPEGIGWDNLGRRTPMFIVLHRMCGTLNSTDSFFPQASTQALTDFGIGTANVDGASGDGVIIKWNDPRGYRAGWSSGPVSAPYGDALRWIQWSGNKWGVSICNVCGVSIEHSGQYGDSMTDFAFSEDAKLVAYWLDQIGVHWDKAPLHPVTGISAITWHQEWCIGSGKTCPGPWLMNKTDALIAAAAAIMKPYQTGSAGGPVSPAPAPAPVPAPTYASPQPLKELATYTAKDADSAPTGLPTSIGTAIWVNDDVQAIRDTKRLQSEKDGAPEVGPVLKNGDNAHILWLVTRADGKEFYYSSYYTFFVAADFKRIKD
ncbi:MAG: hypothetical protein ACR2OE_15970 [Thermomicrobiales bacterium]